MTSLKDLFILTICIIMTSHVFGKDINRLSMLNGRYSCDFPESGKYLDNSNVQSVIDSYSESITDIVVDLNKERILFHATELYFQDNGDLEKTLTNECHKTNSEIKLLTVYDSLVCYSITPVISKKKTEPITIRSFIILHPDKSISKIEIIISPKSVNRKGEICEISDKIISTLKKGSKRYNLNAHTEQFNVVNTKTKLKFILPENYIAVSSVKSSEEYYTLVKIEPYGNEGKTELTLLFGTGLVFVNKLMKMTQFRTPDTHSKFMNANLLWYNFYDNNRNIYLRENIFDDDDVKKGCQYRIDMMANSNNGIDELSSLLIKNVLLVYDK